MKDKYFLYVGNAYPHKNVEVLIRAAAEAHVKVIYVGKDDYFYKRLGITPKSVSDKELAGLYKNATALVFPSLMEGFGLPALEALREGCPVIVSDIPVFHEILGDSAIYFDPHDVSALIKILSSKIDKPKRLEKTYSWQKMAKETLLLYENCARV
jgi:glycosyltransferase involved in cell wall biosynthesis